MGVRLDENGLEERGTATDLACMVMGSRDRERWKRFNSYRVKRLK